MKIESVEFVKSAHVAADFVLDDRPQVAFAGRSNVGKSSLINRLVGRKGLARTSRSPGRTRAVNYFLVNRRFYLVDLPGYGYAKAGRQERRQWAETVDAYLTQFGPGLRIILLIDAKVGPTSLDVQAFEFLSGLGASLTVAVTKSDRVPRHQRSQLLTRISKGLGASEGTRVIAVSARSGEGIADLRRELTADS